MHALFETEIDGEHGAVECWNAGAVEHGEREAGEVAVSEERLGMRAQKVEVELVEEIIRAIAAAHTDDGARLGIGEGFIEIAEALLRRAGKKERAARGGGAWRDAARSRGRAGEKSPRQWPSAMRRRPAR